MTSARVMPSLSIRSAETMARPSAPGMARALEPPGELAIAAQDAPDAVGHGAAVAAADEAAGAEEGVGDQIGRPLLPADDLVEQFHGGGNPRARCHVDPLLVFPWPCYDEWPYAGRAASACTQYSYWRSRADGVPPHPLRDPPDRAGSRPRWRSACSPSSCCCGPSRASFSHGPTMFSRHARSSPASRAKNICTTTCWAMCRGPATRRPRATPRPT